jgi:hypothetical protein
MKPLDDDEEGADFLLDRGMLLDMPDSLHEFSYLLHKELIFSLRNFSDRRPE